MVCRDFDRFLASSRTSSDNDSQRAFWLFWTSLEEQSRSTDRRQVVTVSDDDSDLDERLKDADGLIFFGSGPLVDKVRTSELTRQWVREGKLWLILRGTTGGSLRATVVQYRPPAQDLVGGPKPSVCDDLPIGQSPWPTPHQSLGQRHPKRQAGASWGRSRSRTGRKVMLTNLSMASPVHQPSYAKHPTLEGAISGAKMRRGD